jgi:hypothetical protein
MMTEIAPPKFIIEAIQSNSVDSILKYSFGSLIFVPTIEDHPITVPNTKPPKLPKSIVH